MIAGLYNIETPISNILTITLPYCVLLQCFSLCLHWALNVHLQVSSSLLLLPGQPLELPAQVTGTFYLRSSHNICYSLYKTGCKEVARERGEGGKEKRDAHVVKAGEEEAVHSEFTTMIVVTTAPVSMILMFSYPCDNTQAPPLPMGCCYCK